MAAIEWRQSEHPCYEVSEYGDLRCMVARSNKPIGTLLKGSIKHGYRWYKIGDEGNSTRKGRFRHYAAHRLVLFAFVGPPPTPKHQTAHWDGNPLNNHFSNLRWATTGENTEDKIRHGNLYEGHRKYTTEQVLDMRAMREEGSKYSDIMDKYNISKGNLSAIINRQTWDHI